MGRIQVESPRSVYLKLPYPGLVLAKQNLRIQIAKLPQTGVRAAGRFVVSPLSSEPSIILAVCGGGLERKRQD